MIDFYTFGPAFETREAGPFCLKLMAYLALAEVPHNTIVLTDPRKAPKQKMPYIVEDGVPMGDSELIISHLKTKFGDPLSKGLTEEQKGMGHALKVMFGESYYWSAIIQPRWIDEGGKPHMVKQWFMDIPGPIRGFVTKYIFKGMKKAADGHGIGRHTPDEITALAMADLQAFERALGDKPYILGDTPSEADCTCYAFMSTSLAKPFNTPMSRHIEGSPKLIGYIARMEQAVFG